MHSAHGGKNIVYLQILPIAAAPEFVGDDVKQHFGVALGVDVAMVGMGKLGA